MNNNLKNAFQNPSMVILSGPTESRPSLNKSKGLIRIGANLMLAIALISPLNAMAAQQNQISGAFEQTTEMVAEAPYSGDRGAASQAGETQKVDWFKAEIDGRNWTNAPTENGQIFHVPTWVKHGVLMDRSEAVSKGLDPLTPPAPIVLTDTRTQEAAPKKENDVNKYTNKYEAVREAEDIAEAKAGAGFSLGRNPYNMYKKWDLDGNSLKEASPKEMQTFIARLVRDAYIEMKAGHTAENPSQKLINVCHHVEDVAKVKQVTHQDPAEKVFEACQSSEMQSSMIMNTALKGAAFTGIAVVSLLAKSASILAIIGASARFGGSQFLDNMGISRISAWRSRKPKDGMAPDPEQKPTPKVSTI